MPSTRRRTERSHLPRSRARTLAEALLAVAVVGSVLAVGSVHRPVLFVVSSVVIASAAVTERFRQDPFFSPPVALLIGLAAYSALQALPLPAPVLTWLAASNAEVWRRSLIGFGDPGPAWVSVSLDPGASLVETLKWLSYAAAFRTASTVAAQRGATWGVALVCASGAAAALVTVAHGLAGAKKVYGVYEPHFQVAAWHLGPLLNPNNLAGYLNLAALCGIGLLISAKTPGPRFLVGSGIAVMIAVDVSSASRGGLLVLLVGLAIFVSVTWSARWRTSAATRRRAAPWLVLCVLAGGVLLALLGGTPQVLEELRDKNLTKLRMAQWVWPMVRDHPWFGIGRGAFESVFSAYRSGPGNLIYAHAENFAAQWVAEWGPVVGLGAVAGFAWLLRPGRFGVGRRAVATGAWVGVVVLALHNLFDLALEVPGVMFAVMTVFGTLWGAAERRQQRHPSSRRSAWAGSLWSSVALATAGFEFVALAAHAGLRDVAADRRSIHALYDNGAGARSPQQRALLRRELRVCMARHPAEPYFPLMAAILAMEGKDANPLPWLSRALERGPTNGRVHLLLAEVLAQQGQRGQALMELRFAASHEPALAFPVARRVLRWAHDPEERLRAVPDGEAGVTVLETLAALEPNDAAQRRRWLTEALARAPHKPSAHAAMAAELLAELALADGSTTCGQERRSECLRAVRDHARAVAAGDRLGSVALRLEARVLRLEGNPEAAEKLLAERCQATQDRSECLRARVEAAAECQPPASLPAAIKDYLAACSGIPSECADAASFVADLEAARGNWGSALQHRIRAARAAPTEQRWLRVADAARMVGADTQAREALHEAAKLKGGPDPQLNEPRTEEPKATDTPSSSPPR